MSSTPISHTSSFPANKTPISYRYSRTKLAEIAKDLAAVINKHSLEAGSNTPDFMLADYLICCLKNYDAITVDREKWYSREPEAIPPDQCPEVPPVEFLPTSFDQLPQGAIDAIIASK